MALNNIDKHLNLQGINCFCKSYDYLANLNYSSTTLTALITYFFLNDG